jgi:hypothetical protein
LILEDKTSIKMKKTMEMLNALRHHLPLEEVLKVIKIQRGK